MLTLEHVTKRYGAKLVLSDVTATVGDGRLVALLGPNGSGKTTLMKLIAGLATPTSGSIAIGGNKVGTATKADVAYMPTEAFFYSYMTALDAGKYYADFFPGFDMDAYLKNLTHEAIDHKAHIRTMSSGMVAKVKLALTLSRDAKLVMLDEPLNGIDILARESTLNAIKTQHDAGRTLIVSSHLVDELEALTDDVMFIKNGEMVLFGDAKALREERGMSIVDMYKSIYGDGVQNA